MQNLVFDKDTVECAMLEKELERQMEELEGKQDGSTFGTASSHKTSVVDNLMHKAESAVHQAENVIALEETIADESTMEAVVVCSMLAAMILLSQLIH